MSRNSAYLAILVVVLVMHILNWTKLHSMHQHFSLWELLSIFTGQVHTYAFVFLTTYIIYSGPSSTFSYPLSTTVTCYIKFLKPNEWLARPYMARNMDDLNLLVHSYRLQLIKYNEAPIGNLICFSRTVSFMATNVTNSRS